MVWLVINRASWVLIIFLSIRVVLISTFSVKHQRRSKAFLEPRASTEEPLVSIIVPCYNEGPTLANCACGLLRQTYPKCEILLVDDGGKDDTLELARGFADAHEQIVAYHKANDGNASALRHGIDRRDGSLVVCIDADSLFMPTTVDPLVKTLDDPTIQAVGGNVRVANRKGVLAACQALDYIIGLHSNGRAYSALGCMQVIPGAIGAFRRDVYYAVGGHSADTLVEDMHLTIAFAYHGYGVVFHPHALAYTEAPIKLKGFINQRHRWTLGGMQVLGKYRNTFLLKRWHPMSIIGLPTHMFSPRVNIAVSMLLIKCGHQAGVRGHRCTIRPPAPAPRLPHRAAAGSRRGPTTQSRKDSDRRLTTLRRPKIVLVVPAHNEEVGIEATMNSVENQTLTPDLRIIISDNSTDRTVEIAKSHPGWLVWETENNTGKKGGALNQVWERLKDMFDDEDYFVTMDADTILAPDFVEEAFKKYMTTGKRMKLGGVCANFTGLPLDSALGILQEMEYARANKINRSRRGIAPVLAGAATMFSIKALRAVYDRRGRLYEPWLTEDYELTIALRVQGYRTMAPRACIAHTDLMPTFRMLWAQRIRWYRGAFECLRHYGMKKGIRADICWLAFSLWAAVSRWLFLIALTVTLITVGHMSFSPWLLSLFAFASFLRMSQVRVLGLKYMLLAGAMVEELYYAFFLEAVLWRSVYLAFFGKTRGTWE